MQDLLFGENVGRRVFVKGLGFISMAFVMGMFGGCESIIDAINNRPIRRRLRTGTAEVDADIATYRQAVALMKQLDNDNPTDKRSWKNQAAIHGSTAGFNLCEHDSSDDPADTAKIQFFTWHRAYVFYFEKICQELTGNKKFGLPYWNWNQTSSIHPAFLDTSSPLFMSRERTSIPGWAAPNFSNQTMDIIFSDANFFTFSKQLEGAPHNSLHGVIGQTMGSGASPLDPIFWAHHNMVDYCWAKWNFELENNIPNDPAWRDVSWDYFVDGKNNPVTITAGTTGLMPLLSYRFESSTIGTSTAALGDLTQREFERLEKRIKEGADIRFDVKKRIRIAERAPVTGLRPFSSKLNVSTDDFATLINTDFANEKVFASLHFATAPEITDFFVRVFLNLPDANINTPVEDPHYAGSFAFFGKHAHPAEHQSHGPNFLVNVSETLRRLKQRGESPGSEPLSVQLVPVPYSEKMEDRAGEIVLEKVDLLVTPVIAKTG
jgi:tyrosinase